eukprot:Skav224639  [mRNA]  locus=scaffold1918:36700:37287:+ [translate_table: standard]
MHTGDEVQELSFLFRQLEITVRVSVRNVGESASPSAASFVQVSELPASDFPVLSSQDQQQLLAAVGPEALLQIRLPFLQTFERSLRGEHSRWTPAARLARAYRAGVIARLRLSGEYLPETSLEVPFRNSVYIILRSPAYPEGAWTSQYQAFIAACGGNRTQSFHRDTVCQALPTRAESEAFLLGAHRTWPQQLPQ